jgi:hypothetical protein
MSASPANSSARMCMRRSIFAKEIWRIAALADLKFLAAVIFRKSGSGMASPVSKCRAKRSSPSRSQHQFSMIWEGSSTKSQATGAVERLDLDLAHEVVEEVPELVEDGLDLAVREKGRPPGAGGVRLPQMRPRCGSREPSGLGPPVIRAFIHAPPRLDSLGCQSA